MSDPVTMEIRETVAHVRLNRPEKYNALNAEMFSGIIEAGDRIRKDPSIRAVVLSGNGRGFCAGLDFGRFMGMAAEGEERGPSLLARERGAVANVAQQVAHIWKEVPVPVVASLHGAAYGGGLQIALGADVRFASPDARFSVMEIKWGLIPDMSISQTLRDLVRIDVAKELTFTGRIVTAGEAEKLGLVTRVCEDPLASAEAFAEEIAGKSPDAVAAAKALYDSAWHATREEGLLREEALQRSLVGSANQKEAVRANFEKRAPAFSPRR